MTIPFIYCDLLQLAPFYLFWKNSLVGCGSRFLVQLLEVPRCHSAVQIPPIRYLNLFSTHFQMQWRNNLTTETFFHASNGFFQSPANRQRVILEVCHITWSEKVRFTETPRASKGEVHWGGGGGILPHISDTVLCRHGTWSFAPVWY